MLNHKGNVETVETVETVEMSDGEIRQIEATIATVPYRMMASSRIRSIRG